MASIDVLTPALLSEALATPVESIETEAVGTGQVASSIRVTITYADGGSGPATVVAKLPSDDPTSRATSAALRSYLIETSFYRDLAPTLPVRAPRCFHVSHDPVTDDFVLLLEDMAPAEQGDQITGCTPAVAAVAVEHLPLLHGPRWGDPSLRDLEWLARSTPETAAFTSQLLLSLLDLFEERYAARVDDDILALARRALPSMTQASMAQPEAWTVQHGDYRLDNLLFGAGGGAAPIAVVDWQTVVHGHGVMDLSYFIGAGLVTDDRRAHEESLVRLYQEGLAAQGVSIEWDQLWRDYRRFTMAGLAMAIGASGLVGQTDRGDDMFVAMAQRHGRHALDLEIEAVL
jgi:Phosphotransferase enzyme family